MDPSFWHQRWQNNEIAFHEAEPNQLLVKYFETLSLAEGARVFLPLCGKTHDIAWLRANGLRVAGAELSQLAIEQLFIELGVSPTISAFGDILHYSAENIDIYVGDIFNVSAKALGAVDAIYDRAALVALPLEMRQRYTKHLTEMTNQSSQLLITYEYNQDVMDGPPFSVSNEEVKRHYQDKYTLTLLASGDVPGGLKGRCAAVENIWLLKND